MKMLVCVSCIVWYWLSILFVVVDVCGCSVRGRWRKVARHLSTKIEDDVVT